MTLAELTTFLNARLGTQWDTDAQAKWRVQWLENFEKVVKSGEKFFPRETSVHREVRTLDS